MFIGCSKSNSKFKSSFRISKMGNIGGGVLSLDDSSSELGSVEGSVSLKSYKVIKGFNENP
jgi:hypothetical protein